MITLYINTLFIQLHPRLLLPDGLQADPQRVRVGQNQHRQEQQPQGLPAQPLREGPDVALRQVPRLLHGSHSGDNYFYFIIL